MMSICEQKKNKYEYTVDLFMNVFLEKILRKETTLIIKKGKTFDNRFSELQKSDAKENAKNPVKQYLWIQRYQKKVG